MNHVIHIQNNKKYLDLRWQILKLMREFFWSQDFTEVETPVLLRLPGQEPYLSPMKVHLHNEKGEEFTGFLHTSPEYTMKKMLAAGYEKIFSLGKVFRDHESFGGTHNPEFTMIEWYRAHADFTALMDDVEQLFAFVHENMKTLPLQGGAGGGLLNHQTENLKGETKNRPHLASPHRGGNVVFERIHMRDLWKEYIGINLDDYLEKEKMFELCVTRGFAPQQEEAYEDLFYRIFLNEIEPKLATRGGVIVHHYPKQMAALSRMSETDPGYAERIEVYINGLELANGFGELTDSQEQEERLREEQALRGQLGKEVFDLDQEFVEAVGNMPPSAGIALGVDRLVQFFAGQAFPEGKGCQNINSVIALPASKLFED